MSGTVSKNGARPFHQLVLNSKSRIHQCQEWRRSAQHRPIQEDVVPREGGGGRRKQYPLIRFRISPLNWEFIQIQLQHIQIIHYRFQNRSKDADVIMSCSRKGVCKEGHKEHTINPRLKRLTNYVWPFLKCSSRCAKLVLNGKISNVIGLTL